MITVGHSFSTLLSNSVCSLGFLVALPPFLGSTQTAAVGGHDTLVSTCTNANGGFDETRDRWSDLNDILWDGGQIGDNTQDILVVHHDPANITPAAPGIPPLSLAPTPPQWKNTLLGAADVAGANEEYLVLRDRNGPDRTTLLVWNRKSRQWSSVPRPPGRFAYRIFGSWLTATALTCETPEDSLDETCVSQAKSMIDLRTGKTLPIEDAGKDSEIILLAPDGKGLLRQGQRLSTFAAGSPVSTREKVAQDEIIAHVHWAWYR